MIYQKFIEQNNGKPITEEILEKILLATGVYINGMYPQLQPKQETAENIRNVVLDGLNIGFMIGESNIKLNLCGNVRYEKYTEASIEFSDPTYGIEPFDVLQLTPREDKKVLPAIIILHGHNEDNKVSKDRWVGQRLAEAGFLVLMPTFKAMSGGVEEEEVAKRLMLNGFTLMGIRVYETILLLSYLKYQTFYNVGKIGIMSHSGGSTIGILTAIVRPDIQAFTYDMDAVFNNLYEGKIHCQTIPQLIKYENQINRRCRQIPDSKRFEYKYINQKDKVINYFKEKLL